MDKPDLIETTLGTTDIYNGKVVRLEKSEVRLPNGRTSIREVVRHPGAVAILAQPKSGELLLVEQYRYATGEVLFELPAGKLEPGEAPDSCALRELEEETGYTAGELTHVYDFYTSPGFADEKISLFYADKLQAGNVHLDDDEFVNVHVSTREELIERLHRGEIRDAKTLVGILWWLEREQL